MSVFNKKGQNMAEYSILIALVIAAAIGIRVYVQRGVQARIHDEADKLGTAISNAPEWTQIPSAVATLSPQFEPAELSRKATMDTSEDKETYKMFKDAGKEGTTSREITKKTTQEAGDYEQYQYNK